jgi:hypothetical protein
MFEEPPIPYGDPSITPEAAAARLAERKADPDWRRRYLAGGADEARELFFLQSKARQAAQTPEDFITGPSRLSDDQVKEHAVAVWRFHR